MAALVQLSEGTIFAGDFRVVRPLSEGGMGAVYVVEQVSTGKQRALKVMHPNLVGDVRQRQRFVQEAKIGARVESDHVVEVLGAGIDQATDTPWLVMELLQGETLDERLTRTQTMSPRELVEVYKQLCHALAAAHDAGIVHRDLKPENIFLAVPRREGIPFVVKVLDFGIAKLVAESGNVTQAIGSPLWMAPEQTNAEAPIVPATDVWALGLIAFAALTGHSYWRGAHAETPNPMTIVMEVCFEQLDPASQRATEYGASGVLPRGFDEWFAQCVSRDVNQRFSNARPARAALERLLSSDDGPTTRVVATPIAAGPEARVEAPDLDIPVSKPKPEKSKEVAKPAPAPAPARVVEPKPQSRRAQPERIIIPPIKAAAPRVSYEPVAAVAYERAFPWKPVAGIAGLVLVGLFVAQRVLWTKPPAPEVAPPVASDDPKTKSGKPSTTAPFESCPVGTTRLPAGELVAGDPTRAVESFCLDTHEVTVKAYAVCVKARACTPSAASGNWVATTADERTLRNQSCNVGRKDRDDHPINCVDWTQADTYCKTQGKRLPTDAEWEWAARSGPVRYKYPWGFESPDVQLCWSGFQKRTSTCSIGAYPKGGNSFGVFDLAGNVREWTSTTAGGDRLHCGSDWTDKGADDLFKLGYCGQAPRTARSAFLGFRCAK